MCATGHHQLAVVGEVLAAIFTLLLRSNSSTFHAPEGWMDTARRA
jgi:hypothetical protein